MHRQFSFIRKRARRALLLFLLVAPVACASISYEPRVSLGTSPETLPASVRVGEFMDRTPPDDHRGYFGGTSATEPGTLVGDLAPQVANAVASDFQINAVFREVSKSASSPDLVMTGVIYRFHSTAGLNPLGIITIPVNLIWLLGLPVGSNESIVDLEIQFATPDGRQVAVYRRTSESKGMFTLYNDRSLSSGSRLNADFSVAVAEIRAAVLADRQRLLP